MRKFFYSVLSRTFTQVTNFSNAFGQRMVLCPSGFINFALLKNMCTYQVISNITYGAVNFPKIGAKSSKPQNPKTPSNGLDVRWAQEEYIIID